MRLIVANPEDDARGQYAPSQADRKASGVASAKPTVITNSDDATVHRDPTPALDAGLLAAAQAVEH
jgi:hypothetical protein